MDAVAAKPAGQFVDRVEGGRIRRRIRGEVFERARVRSLVVHPNAISLAVSRRSAFPAFRFDCSAQSRRHCGAQKFTMTARLVLPATDRSSTRMRAQRRRTARGVRRQGRAYARHPSVDAPPGRKARDVVTVPVRSHTRAAEARTLGGEVGALRGAARNQSGWLTAQSGRPDAPAAQSQSR